MKARPVKSLAALIIATAMAAPQSAQAQQSLPPQKEYFIGEGQVDLHRGTFLYSHTDIAGGPQGSPGGLEFTRYYGVREEMGAFGWGTAHNFDIDLRRKGFVEEGYAPEWKSYRYTVTIGRTTETFVKDYVFSGTPSIKYEGGSGGYHVLVEHGATGPYTYYGPDGLVITFGTESDLTAPVTSLTKADGTHLTFTGQTGFRLVSNNHGYGIGFEYATHGGLTKACALNLAIDYVTTGCPSGSPAATYGWTSPPNPQMVSYTDPSGQTTTYSAGGNISSIQSPGSPTPDVTITFHPISGKVATQTLANGASWTYHYQTEGQTWWVSEGQNQWTEVTNPAGKTLRYEFLGAGGSKPSRIRDELGRETNFMYTWAGGGLASVPLREIKQEGNYTHYSYTGGWTKPTEVRQVAKPGSGQADIVTYATYPTPPCTNPKICDKPLTTTDARNAVTNYSYDSNHGGMVSEMKPPAAAGGARPLKLFSWAQRYAYVKNSSGALVQAATPVWVVTSETECQTVPGANTPVCDNAAPITVTTLEYTSGPAVNALLPRGKLVSADNTTRRTCFGYDSMGRRISETTPNGTTNLMSCP